MQDPAGLRLGPAEAFAGDGENAERDPAVQVQVRGDSEGCCRGEHDNGVAAVHACLQSYLSRQFHMSFSLSRVCCVACYRAAAPASLPPSMGMVAPEMNEAWSEQSQAAVAATSSDEPSRANGR